MRQTPLLLSLAFGFVSAVPFVSLADPPARDMAKTFGYGPDIVDQMPTTQGPRAPNPQRRPSVSPREPALDSGLLHRIQPRVYQHSEPSSLLPTLLRLHQQQPASPKITRKLALTCLQAGQTREALHWFMQTFQRDRSDLAALWNMAALSLQLGDKTAAHAYLAQYAHQDSYSPWGRMAKRFLASEGSLAGNSSEDFQGTAPHIGYIDSSPVGSGNSGSMLVIDGRTITPDEFGAAPIESPVVNPFKPLRKAEAGTTASGSDSVRLPAGKAGTAVQPPLSGATLGQAKIDTVRPPVAKPAGSGSGSGAGSGSGSAVPPAPPAGSGSAAPPPPPPRTGS